MITQRKSLSVRLAVKTTEVKKNLEKIISAFEGFSLQKERDAARVDVLVLEIGSNPEAEFKTIRALLKDNVVGCLFLTSDRTTSDILLPALRAGAKEFFPQPIDQEEVTAAFQKVLNESLHNTQAKAEPESLGEIISVLGAKGGVGTTTFAVNLATSIQALDKEKSIALIDMNRLVGEVPLFLDLETDTNWEEIGKNISRLDAAYLQSAMVRHSSGVYVMPAPGSLDTETEIPAGLLFILVKAMRRFFDYIVIDCGMYFDDNLFKIFTESGIIYIVSILSLPCIINVKKLQESICTNGGASEDKLRIIANRFEKKAHISLAQANKIIGREIAGTIPNNYALAMTAINNGKTLDEIGHNSNIAKEYQKIAGSIVRPEAESGSGFFNWFRKT